MLPLELTCIKKEKQKDVTRERFESQCWNVEGRDTGKIGVLGIFRYLGEKFASSFLGLQFGVEIG